MSSKVSSTLIKVRAMSLGEVAARTSYELFLALERRLIASRGAPPAGSPGLVSAWRAVIADRRRGSKPSLFPSLAERQAMRSLFSADGPYHDHAARTRRAADAAARHEFEFFGGRFEYGPEIDWHADPVTRRPWPRVFHRDVPIHEGEETIGDVKYVWELNRHQFLIDLGKAHFLFDDDAAASAIYRIVRNWIAQNPYGMGVNWSCALEPAFRAWSWLWAYQFCAADPQLDDETHALWLSGFNDHGRFLYRHLEYYSSPYNHLAGEASALYALGVLFPEMPEAHRWRQRGRRVLQTRLRSQFHADGGSVEQSTFYHHATLGFYILAVLLGEANGDPFPADVDAAIEKGLEFSMALTQPDGTLPAIGGADDGKCIRLEHLPLRDFRPFLAFGAVRYGREDFRSAAAEFFEDALWLLGPNGRDRFLSMSPSTPPAARALNDSGYYILRTGWTRQADFVCFDCGEQAAGLRRDDVPSAAHGHADCLSVVVWLRGQPVLLDPGFFCYNGDPEWEVHFRRTAAHNTACIDGRDQSRHERKMAWSQVFAPRIEAWHPGDAGGAVGGSHDGYARQIDGFVHRRAVWLHPSGCCIICDQLTGPPGHAIDVNFQLAPGRAQLEESVVLFEHAELVWAATAPVDAHLRCGEPGPGGGWIAPSLGVKVAAPRLTLRLTSVAPSTTCLTLVLPRNASQARQSVVRAGVGGRLGIGWRTGPAEDEIDWFEVPTEPAAPSARELITSLSVRKEERPAALTVWKEELPAPDARLYVPGAGC